MKDNGELTKLSNRNLSIFTKNVILQIIIRQHKTGSI